MKHLETAVPDPNSPSQLEQHGRELRRDIDDTLAELTTRLSPSHLRKAARDGVRKQALRIGGEVRHGIVERPKTTAALVLAAGVICGAWLRRRR